MILAEELAADWSTMRPGPMAENPAEWSRKRRTGGCNTLSRPSGVVTRTRPRGRGRGAGRAVETVQRRPREGHAGRAPRGGARAELVDGLQGRLGGGLRRRSRRRGGYLLAGGGGTTCARDRVGRGGLGRARFGEHPRPAPRPRRAAGHRGPDARRG